MTAHVIPANMTDEQRMELLASKLTELSTSALVELSKTLDEIMYQRRPDKKYVGVLEGKCRLTRAQRHMLAGAIEGYVKGTLDFKTEDPPMTARVQELLELCAKRFRDMTIFPTESDLAVAAFMRHLPYTHYEQGTRQRDIQERAWRLIESYGELISPKPDWVISKRAIHLYTYLDPGVDHRFLCPRCNSKVEEWIWLDPVCFSPVQKFGDPRMKLTETPIKGCQYCEGTDVRSFSERCREVIEKAHGELGADLGHSYLDLLADTFPDVPTLQIRYVLQELGYV